MAFQYVRKIDDPEEIRQAMPLSRDLARLKEEWDRAIQAAMA